MQRQRQVGFRIHRHPNAVLHRSPKGGGAQVVPKTTPAFPYSFPGETRSVHPSIHHRRHPPPPHRSALANSTFCASLRRNCTTFCSFASRECAPSVSLGRHRYLVPEGREGGGRRRKRRERGKEIGGRGFQDLRRAPRGSPRSRSWRCRWTGSCGRDGSSIFPPLASRISREPLATSSGMVFRTGPDRTSTTRPGSRRGGRTASRSVTYAWRLVDKRTAPY